MMEKDRKSDPSEFENYDYHVRPWMIPYLPESPARRDAAMLFGALLIIDLVSVILGFCNYARLTVAILAIGHGHFIWHYYERMTQRWQQKNHKRSDQ